MPIYKGDRVGHLDGILGIALTDGRHGTFQVKHDSGAVSTWAIRDAALIRRGSPGPAVSAPETPVRPKRKRAPPRRAAAKRPASKKAVKKPRKEATARKKAGRVARRKNGAKARLAKK